MSTSIFSLPKTNNALSTNNSTATGVGGVSSFTDITNMSVTITTLGKPVLVSMQPDAQAGYGYFQFPSNGYLRLLRNDVEIAQWFLIGSTFHPGFSFVDLSAPAGTHTYKFQSNASGGSQASVRYMRTVAVEWG